VLQQDLDALLAEAPGHQLGDLRVLAHHQPRQHLHLDDPGAEAGEALRQLAADRPAAEHHQALRQFAQVPDVVRGATSDQFDAGIGGTKGRAPAAMTMARVLRLRVLPSACFTSTR